MKDIVINSLKYLDSNYDTNNKIINKFKYFRLEITNNEFSRNKIIFFDGDKQKIKEYEYEIIGIYIDTTKTWTWAWAIPYLKKNSIALSRKILNHGLDLPHDSPFLKTELITSRYLITDPIQLDIHLGITSYIAKQPLLIGINKKLDVKMTSLGSDEPDQNITYYLFLI